MTYRADDYAAAHLLTLKGAQSVAVVIPAREVAETVAGVVGPVALLRSAGVIDEVLVIDAASRDGSAEVAAAAGATVLQEAELLPEFGPVLGKGDAMWRALSATTADVVCFVDSDTVGFGDHFVRGLIGPLLEERTLQLVKGAYRRPFTSGELQIADGGGRVSELTARPLLNLFFPELADLQQPLSGELAARRAALASIPFMTGYGVEIQMLIDLYAQHGRAAIVQSDLGVRINAHQPLSSLSAMAFTILRAVMSRTGNEALAAAARSHIGYRDGVLERYESELVERPPLASLAAEQ